MKDQHEKIKGYRDLSQEEIDLMNEIKVKADEVGLVVAKLQRLIETKAEDNPARPDPRWVHTGETDLQKGFMALVRSVAKPTSF